eukprot:gb/GECH01001729.1/.p1 GENE.gb/GECH01001729.1/~~gb/GECH01001729.1/.p1  ORF type:complete len:439 (+),score=99.77 gb/GECH01001729.1/:1-1317(+)
MSTKPESSNILDSQEVNPQNPETKQSEVEKGIVDQTKTSSSEEEEALQSTWHKTIKLTLQIILSIIMGLGFGFALEKSRVFSPHLIVDQMLFRRFVMLKVFLTAVTTGLIFFGVMTLISTKLKETLQVARESWLGCGKGIPATALGTFLLGMGMTIAGACPGTVFAQIGSGVTWSGLTVLGGLLAAFVYPFVVPFLRKYFLYKLRLPSERDTFDKLLPSWVPLFAQFFALTIPFIIVIVLLEVFFPWKDDLQETAWSDGIPSLIPNSLRLKPWGNNCFVCDWAWPPIACGVIIGSLQPICVMTVQETLGSSTSFQVVASNLLLLIPPVASRNRYIKTFYGGIDKWWQVIYVVFAIIGAVISAGLSDTYNTAQSFHWARSLVGGFLVVFGARIAGGCTSGHGLSGFAVMGVLALVSVPFMFAGGITMAFILYGFDVEYN